MKHLVVSIAACIAAAAVAAYAAAPYSAIIECGSLLGEGFIEITIGGHAYVTPIQCGRFQA